MGLHQYSRNRAQADGLHSQCKSCDGANRHRYRRADPARAHAQRKAWEARNPHHGLARQGVDVTAGDYYTMLESQGGACAICGWAPEPGERRLCIDHCHESNRVRGLLCHKCNRAIGGLGHSPSRLRNAARYLEG